MKIVDWSRETLKNVTFETTGRKIGAVCGVIGIDTELRAYEGYDGLVCEFEKDLTPQERAELADHMISLWQQFKKGEAR